MKKILLVKTSALGDILQTFSVVEYIKAKIPSSQIDWVVEKDYVDLLLSYSQVDRVISFDSHRFRKNGIQYFSEIRSFFRFLRQTDYDYVFDLQGNCKSGLITLFSKGRKKIGYDFRSVPEWPNWLTTSTHIRVPIKRNMREQYLFLVQQGLGKKEDLSFLTKEISLVSQEPFPIVFPKNRYKILICPHSRWKSKEMSPKILSDLVSLFSQNSSPIFYWVWGSEEERAYVQTLASSSHSEVLPKISLPLLQRVMKEMDLIISVDSSLLHLAGLTSTPLLAVFGPSQSSLFSPLGKQCVSIQGRCSHKKTFPKRCPHLRSCQTRNCMDRSAEEIFSLWKTKISSASSFD